MSNLLNNHNLPDTDSSFRFKEEENPEQDDLSQEEQFLKDGEQEEENQVKLDQ